MRDMLQLKTTHLVFSVICFCRFVVIFSFLKGKSRPTSPFGKPTPYVPQVTYLFVHDKLKKSEVNHYWMTNPENGLSKFIGMGQTVKKYPLTVGKYKTPILIDRPGKGHKILGEIYLVDTFMLRNLDLLQGLPVFNGRKMDVIRIFSEEHAKGSEMLCWVYFAQVNSLDLSKHTLISEYSSKNC